MVKLLCGEVEISGMAPKSHVANGGSDIPPKETPFVTVSSDFLALCSDLEIIFPG